MAARVVIVDPAAAYRRGLGAALIEAGFVVTEGAALDERSPARGPETLVLTLRAPDQLNEIKTILAAEPDTGVVVLVEERRADIVADALRAGAAAVIERNAPPELVVDAIRACGEQHALVPLWAARAISARFPARPDRWVTDEELAWLRLLADGRTVAALADEVGYSEREMFRNLHDLYTRIGAPNRTAALLWAQRHGLLTSEGDPGDDDAR